jgi:hypothetical protein
MRWRLAGHGAHFSLHGSCSLLHTACGMHVLLQATPLSAGNSTAQFHCTFGASLFHGKSTVSLISHKHTRQSRTAHTHDVSRHHGDQVYLVLLLVQNAFKMRTCTKRRNLSAACALCSAVSVLFTVAFVCACTASYICCSRCCALCSFARTSDEMRAGISGSE